MHRLKFGSRIIIFYICLLNCAFGAKKHTHSPGQPPSAQGGVDQPWLTGPLIAPYETAVSVGHVFIEPYANFNTYTGIYNSNWESVSTPNFFSFNPQVLIYVGLTEWMDIFIAPQALCNTSQGQSDTRFGDLPIAFDFQLVPVDTTKWYPSVKLAIQETFPTGHYQHLNPEKNQINLSGVDTSGVDASGNGTYGTNFNFVIYKVIRLWDRHFLSLYGNWGYTINTSVRVAGFNAYGGGYGTKGTVHVGNTWQGLFSFEFTLTRNWVLAMDTVYTHTNKNTFNGAPGTKEDGGIASVGNPSSDRLAFAPAIEYNFNAKIGIIAGCYLTAIGRNTSVFRNGIIALAAYF
jgi:hypothetical protein